MLDVSPIWGLCEGSKVTEVIVRHDGTATRYKVVTEPIDLEALRQEKADLEAMLLAEKPTEEILIEQGKGIDPYYTIDREAIQKRIDKIDSILGA